MPPTSHPPPTRRSFVAVAPAATLFLFLLLPILLPSATAQPASAPPGDEVSSSTRDYGPFNSSVGFVAVIIIVFLLSVCSASLLHCSTSREGSAGRAVHLLRRLAVPRGLDPAVIETFPTVVYSAVKGHKIGETLLECAVCLNDFEDDDVLRLMPKCDHAFHPDCIGAWLASHTTCPVCRADLASQRAGDWQSQQPESGTEPPRVELTIEATSPCSGAPERRQREGEREGIQPPDPGDKENESDSLSNRNRTRGSSRIWRFPRSHSTGHSLIRPGEDNERFTLRLPAEVRKQLMDRPWPVLPLEDSSRRGYRCGDDGSSRGRYFRRLDRLDRAAESERWAFNRMPSLLSRVSPALSPGVAPDSGGGSSRGVVQPARPII